MMSKKQLLAILLLSGQAAIAQKRPAAQDSLHKTRDIATKEWKKIGGLPAVINPSGSFCAVEMHGKTLLRVANKGGVINGYYEYDWANNNAKQLFQVTSGGQVQGFAKIRVNLDSNRIQH